MSLKKWALYPMALFWAAFFLTGCNWAPHKLLFKQLTRIQVTPDDRRPAPPAREELAHRYCRYTYLGTPYTGRVTDYYDNDLKELRFMGEMKNGLPNGLWKYYYANGKIEMQGAYTEGNPDSVWIKYYKDGTKRAVENYRSKGDSLHCDTLNIWYGNGRLMMESVNEISTWYFTNGRVRSIAYGNPVTREEVFNDRGLLISKAFGNLKEIYGTNQEVKKRIYYLHSHEEREKMANEKYAWTNEEKLAIEKADSIEFDYSIPSDPLRKIFVK